MQSLQKKLRESNERVRVSEAKATEATERYTRAVNEIEAMRNAMAQQRRE